MTSSISIKDLPLLEWTVRRYHRLTEEGILEEDDKIELLNGQLIKMSPVGILHAACVKKLRKLLGKILPEEMVIGIQDPVILNDLSEPEPDISILRPKADFYASGKPGVKDILLLIEVADTSLEKDREVKLPLYARAGVPEVWIVDLVKKTVEQYKNPGKDGYYSSRVCRKGESLSTDLIPEIFVKDILP